MGVFLEGLDRVGINHAHGHTPAAQAVIRGERLMKRAPAAMIVTRQGSQGLAAAHGKFPVIIARGAHSPHVKLWH